MQTQWPPAIMDPAEAVLQEKALKFMVRRRCRPGNGVGGGVGGIAEARAWAACPPEEGAAGLWAEAGSGAAEEDGTGAPGRREGVVERTRGGGSSSAILWMRGQVTAGA